jgi:SAM-dependent methyltransferase
MRTSLVLLVAALILLAAPQASLCTQPVSYIPYEAARPILQALSDVVPAELSTATAETWAKWVASRDSEIRRRLAQGDEDSLVNFLLFGTSFTRKPRITLGSLAKVAGKPWRIASASSPEAVAFAKAINARINDLVVAMATPGTNERLTFARRLVESKGLTLTGTASRERIRQYLSDNLDRMLNEQTGYARLLQSARLLGDPSAEFAERSKLYSTRGLSSDTSLLPNFALERALLSIKSQGILGPQSVRRVAIIGPGLDFTDKEDGYDFYPQQTIQPFAIIDTLIRTGLARESELNVTTLDLSPRVNDHLRRARARGLKGQPYTIQLPRDDQSTWNPEAIAYWTRFGDQIGRPVEPVPVPVGIGSLKVRAVRIRPPAVALIHPEDLNIVLQRLNLSEEQSFDLIIATNIFVYYDVLEQTLALSNVKRMLRPGGLLLSNNALLELPGLGIQSVGYETVVYSDRPDHGDHIVWYQRSKTE